MTTAANWQDKADLWIKGFNPTSEGWTPVGPADEDNAIEAAMGFKDRGIAVETFIAPLGKLTYYAQATRQELYGGE